uniref:ATP synthase F0 subunit 8 n=1 Tax=Dasya binghamiae TaxID=1896963 RepID=A0A1C8XRS8_9FLOR|nr:ATP synthase F0 subunit 8 [Dasya binghamiae]AOH77198.1 ATP synthase F0 subunit 8 [Dasya binghamiae]
MPQLDRTIIFPQIFWFFLIFIFIYIVILHFFFPKFLNSLKLRKQLLEFNGSLANEFMSKTNQDQLNILINLNKNLKKIKNSIYLNINKINIIFLNSNLTNPLQLTNRVKNTLQKGILFCNKHILNSIKLYPSSFNYKKN